MSVKERRRMDAFARVARKELDVVSAAELVGLSVRQARRAWKRYRELGDAGLVHGLRGRASNNRIGDEDRARILSRHQSCYRDFGHTHACEKLAADGLVVGVDTLMNLLKERGLWVRRRRRGRHRRRRERRSMFGSMVLCDGSDHDWFEGRAGRCVLMNLVDDATSTTYARLYPAETTQAAFDVLGRWMKRYGVFRELYTDRHSIWRDEDHPEKPTQAHRALQELDVELILAKSPQAKGRVERRHAIFQDRLVKEMRLRRISSIEQANAFLESHFLPQVNGRWTQAARRQGDLHRPAPKNVAEVLCVKEQRVVGQDWCVRWKNRFVQIGPEHELLALAGKRVMVKQLLDGELIVEYAGECLTTRLLNARPRPGPKKKRPVVNNQTWKPRPRHPWREPGRLKKTG